MDLPKTLEIGKFYPDDLVVSVSESNRKINPTIENQIEDIWQERKKKADEEGRLCYNGLSYRLNSIARSAENKIILDFGIIEYKIRDTITKIPGYFDLSEDFFMKGCYLSATVKTSDDLYLMVLLSGKSMNENSIDFLGGVLEKGLELKSGNDIFEFLLSELQEEGCITKSDITEMYLSSISLSTKTHIEFYFEVKLNVSAKEILERFERDNKDEDIDSLKGFSREEYLDVLKSHKSKNKQAIVQILGV